MIRTLYAVHRPRVVPTLDIAALVVGVVATTWPGGVLGLPLTPGPYGAVLWALRSLAYLAPIVVLILLAVVAGHESDHGLVSALHAVGQAADRRRVSAELAVVALLLSRFWAVAAGGAFLAGIGDMVRRAVLGPSAPTVLPSPWSGLVSLPIAAGCLILGWLVLIAAGRSGRALLLVTGATAATLFVWLILTAGTPLHDWVVLHPLGGPWALAYSGESSRLAVDVPVVAKWSSAIIWVAFIMTFGGRALRRSG